MKIRESSDIFDKLKMLKLIKKVYTIISIK